jgi:hypothetical protein
MPWLKVCFSDLKNMKFAKLNKNAGESIHSNHIKVLFQS